MCRKKGSGEKAGTGIMGGGRIEGNGEGMWWGGEREEYMWGMNGEGLRGGVVGAVGREVYGVGGRVAAGERVFRKVCAVGINPYMFDGAPCVKSAAFMRAAQRKMQQAYGSERACVDRSCHQPSIPGRW